MLLRLQLVIAINDGDVVTRQLFQIFRVVDHYRTIVIHVLALRGFVVKLCFPLVVVAPLTNALHFHFGNPFLLNWLVFLLLEIDFENQFFWCLYLFWRYFWLEDL